jgi:dephospho-CoA kinase
MEGILIWIGLTGGIASGKSTVARLLSDKGIPVIDADELARKAIELNSPGYQAVVQRYGSDICNNDGSLNREALGKLIFSNSTEKKWLEELIHPWVQARVLELKNQYQNAGHAAVVYDVPLLFENKLEDQFDELLLVSAPHEAQIERLKVRNNLTAEEAELRIKAQMPMATKKAKAKFFIENNGSLSELSSAVDLWLKKIGL